MPLPTDSGWRELEDAADVAAVARSGSAIVYLRQAKNRCDQPKEKTRLLEKIASFKPLPQMVVRGLSGSVEQHDSRYWEKPLADVVSAEERAYVLKAPGLPRNECRLVARIDGMWVRPEPDLQDRRQLAHLHGEHICPNMPPHKPKVLIDQETGILIYMPRSGTRGQTGHYREGAEIYGPPGPLPWI